MSNNQSGRPWNYSIKNIGNETEDQGYKTGSNGYSGNQQNTWCSMSSSSYKGSESSASSSSSFSSVDSLPNSKEFPSLLLTQRKPSNSHHQGNNNTIFSSKFSGMNLGDVMKVTVMEEMTKLNMTQNKPMDLSDKPKDFSKNNFC